MCKWDEARGILAHKQPDTNYHGVIHSRSPTVDSFPACLHLNKINKSKQQQMMSPTKRRLSLHDSPKQELDYEKQNGNERHLQDDEGDRLSNDDGECSDAEAVQIGKDESKAVNRMRIILVLVLLGAAACISVSVYLYSRGQEQEHFEGQFTVHAEKLIDDFKARTARSLRAIEGFALQITIHSLDHHQEWPNVRLSKFESRARVTIDLSDAISLIFCPIVSNETRSKWEIFSDLHQGWLNESLAYQNENFAYQNSVTDRDDQDSIDQLIETYGNDPNMKIPTEIFELYVDSFVKTETGPGPYAPWWQFAPAFPVSKLVNFNMLSSPSRRAEITALMEASDKTIVGKAFDFADIDEIGTSRRAAILNLFLNRRAQGANDYTGGPVSDLYTPIFNHFAPDKQIVGILTSYVYWQNYFEDVLPSNARGLIVVLENSCGQTFTFQVDGSHATFIGNTELHDEKYDKYKIETGFRDIFLQDPTDDRKGQCLVNIRAYPSVEMENEYLTSTPLLFVGVLASTFFFTSMIFVWYQCLIDKRQKVVMKAAVQSTEVVRSLFPANVRDRLFEETTESQPAAPPISVESSSHSGVDESDTMSLSFASSTIGTYFSGGTKGSRGNRRSSMHGNNGKVSSVQTSETIFGSTPIADLFPNTTIMFADMVGFTAWASVREPTQVFTLLETIYHSFDTIAKKMRVFKVETVGDCYVAVVGLPDPCKDHALVMARFATQCSCKMKELSSALETSLGPDTADLGLRVGLHSGPVTAGVLRGDKGRFQLFGDTMNTASRMESTGVNGRIHLSRETAELLIEAGKSNWVFEREEKVIAKGKGELQTYWLDCEGGSPPVSVTSTKSFESQDQKQETENLSVMTANHSYNKNDDHKITLNKAGQSTRSIVSNRARGSTRAIRSTRTMATRKSMEWASSDGFLERVDGQLESDRETEHSSSNHQQEISVKNLQLIQYNVDMLTPLLRQIIARRLTRRGQNARTSYPWLRHWNSKNNNRASGNNQTVLEEFKDIIPLPKFDADIIKKQKHPDSIHLSTDVMEQLTDLVTDIFKLYRNENPFHNFKHASHVTMSVVKLLSRIVDPAEVVSTAAKASDCISNGTTTTTVATTETTEDQKIASVLHDHTFGITSDPLTQFACVFSALIHDLDHPGVTNRTLIEEKQALAIKYKNKSIAEQNSVDLAWDLIMQSKYVELRNCICADDDELKRFRQLVVNVVMATDIMDKDLGALRKARWDKAFSEESDYDMNRSTHTNGSTQTNESFHNAGSPTSNTTACTHDLFQEDDVNRKATIVIEHLIQASDVAHTMQHWQVFRKWNERLFHEFYQTYLDGRIETDPSVSWYKAEVGFFDFYILPLAKKLDTCGVFGVSSDEYLNYALANRREWEEKGEAIVEEYLRHHDRWSNE